MIHTLGKRYQFKLLQNNNQLLVSRPSQQKDEHTSSVITTARGRRTNAVHHHLPTPGIRTVDPNMHQLHGGGPSHSTSVVCQI